MAATLLNHIVAVDGLRCCIAMSTTLNELELTSVSQLREAIRTASAQFSNEQQEAAYPSPLFLDTRHGDAYEYDTTKGSFRAVLNLGVRAHAYATTANTLASSAPISPVITHDRAVSPVPRNADVLPRLPPGPRLSRTDVSRETVIRLRSSQSHHWIWQKMKEHEFIAPLATHKWDMVESSLYSDRRVTVVASGLCGPAIIEYGHMVCSSFTVSMRYPETVELLAGFVLTKLELLHSFGTVEFTSQRILAKAMASGMSLGDAINKNSTEAPITVGLDNPKSAGIRSLLVRRWTGFSTFPKNGSCPSFGFC